MPNLLSDMPFLPADAPASPVIDCAGILSAADLSRLNAQAMQAHFKPCVVILARSFAPPSMARASSNIAQQWHMSDDSFLMVINLHGHNLRITPGARLRKEGLTDRKITQIIATKFGPHMMHSSGSSKGLAAALPNAVADTINGVNQSLGYKTTEAGQSVQASMPHTGSSWSSGIGLPVVLVAAALMLVLSFLYLKRNRV